MGRSPYYELLDTLEDRFLLNLRRHPGIFWGQVSTRLAAQPEKLAVLLAMEETGGEPDVVDAFPESQEFVFCDCSPESPGGRRSLCYDQAALASRKEHKPSGSAVGFAANLGAQLLTESQYRELQELGEFDLKTSTWLQTPPEIRALGGALFGDRRYDRVFVYHNGAESYYAARGCRVCVKV